jgi:four helix bundle protein
MNTCAVRREPCAGNRCRPRDFGSVFDEASLQVLYMESYQSLHVWQRAHALAIGALRETEAARQPRTWAVFDQLRRAAVSVEANIVEGYALRAPRQFRRHLRIALGSAAETECLLRNAGELDYLPQEVVKRLLILSNSTIGMLLGLLRRPMAAAE